VAIADAYDAMIHDRPYKRAMSHEMAIKELRRHAGTQFDPQLVTLFCDLFAHQPPTPDPIMAAIAAPLHAAAGREAIASASTSAAGSWSAATMAADRRALEPGIVEQAADGASGVGGERRDRSRRSKSVVDRHDIDAGGSDGPDTPRSAAG
jgi:hypothetical protein